MDKTFELTFHKVIQIADKHMKSCLYHLLVRKYKLIHNEIIPNRKFIMKRQSIPNTGKNVKKFKPSCPTGGNLKLCRYFAKHFLSFLKR